MCFALWLLFNYTVDHLKDLFKVTYSEEGSVKRPLEEQTWIHFCAYLDVCEGNVYYTFNHKAIFTLQQEAEQPAVLQGTFWFFIVVQTDCPLLDLEGISRLYFLVTKVEN